MNNIGLITLNFIYKVKMQICASEKDVNTSIHISKYYNQQKGYLFTSERYLFKHN